MCPEKQPGWIFPFEGEKREKREKSEAVVSEERAFILHFLCTIFKVEQWLISQWDTSNKQANRGIQQHSVPMFHAYHQWKIKKINLYCMWNFIILLAKSRQSFFGTCWRLDLTLRVFLTFTLQSPSCQCLFGLCECSLVYSGTFHNLKNNPS